MIGLVPEPEAWLKKTGRDQVVPAVEMNEVGVEYQIDSQRKEELLKSDYFRKKDLKRRPS